MCGDSLLCFKVELFKCDVKIVMKWWRQDSSWATAYGAVKNKEKSALDAVELFLPTSLQR